MLGADESAGPGNHWRLRLWFDSPEARRDARSRLRECSAAASPGTALVELDAVAPRDWNAPFRAFFRGVRAGGFFIHPPFVPPDPVLPSLLLDPGAAFGTGAHPTTRMVLEILREEIPRRRSDSPGELRVLDVGTGSGILATAAALANARFVVGLERDPAAVASARRTAASNGTAGRVSILEGDFRDSGIAARLARAHPDGFRLVLANLSAEALPELAAFARARLHRRGVLVIAGFLRSQARSVLEAVIREGFRLVGLRAEIPEPPDPDRWIAATLRMAAE